VPRRHPGGAHLQHLRSAHAPQRRARGFQLHRAGAAQRAHHHLRPRPADPQLLLRRRPGRRLPAVHAAPGPAPRPHQPGQPARVHDHAIGRAGHQHDQFALAHRLQAVAVGRPAAAAAGHQPRPRATGLGTDRAAARGPHAHHRLLRRDAHGRGL
ncbi:MAG: UDP-glucuronate decarboxylase, partial [uncultured Ramlibacter sp.]